MSFTPWVIVSLACCALIAAYFINGDFYAGDEVCKANGYLSGGFDKNLSSYYCLDVNCPQFYAGEFGNLCKQKIEYFRSLTEIKPEGILKRQRDKTFDQGGGLDGWTV